MVETNDIQSTANASMRSGPKAYRKERTSVGLSTAKLQEHAADKKADSNTSLSEQGVKAARQI